MRKKCVFARSLSLSLDECARLCGKSRQTIQRWERDGWPDGYRHLVELHDAGRVMPARWTKNARFDAAGNLHTSAGTLNLAQVLGIDYQVLLIDDLRRALERERKEVRELRALVNSLASDAANDHFA